MSISHRVRILLDKEKSMSSFAKKIGITPTSLASVIKKDAGLRSSTIISILKLYDNPKLNPGWFLLGEEPMWLDGTNEISKNGVVVKEKEGKESDEEMKRLMRQRIFTLEREIKENHPDLAEKLGID